MDKHNLPDSQESNQLPLYEPVLGLVAKKASGCMQIAQPVKCWSCRHEDLVWIHRAMSQSWVWWYALAVPALNSREGSPGLRDQLALSNWTSFGPMRDSVSISKVSIT